MKPAEIENLIQVKTMLAEKYRQKGLNAGSAAKRRQSTVRARTYTRQIETLRRLQEAG